MLLKIFISASFALTVLLVTSHSYAFELPEYFKKQKMFDANSVSNQAEKTGVPDDVSLSDYNDRTKTKNILLAKYRHWKGVKYRWGGDSKNGIDCSAFSRRVLKELSVHLPRTTAEQIRTGDKITKQQLNVGDLVFFKTSRLDRHVGIYIGNDEFIHASRTMGVTTSNLNNIYWMKRYETSIRVI